MPATPKSIQSVGIPLEIVFTTKLKVRQFLLKLLAAEAGY
jgi:hypothetical protein